MASSNDTSTSSAASTSPLTIRRATSSDSRALSHICLLTADAGASAASLHKAGELPGLMYAEPYVHMPESVGFVLVDTAKVDNADGHNGVVGYVLATHDTRAFERSLRETWLPPYLAKYPLWAGTDSDVPESGGGADVPEHLRDLTPNDKNYIRTIHNPSSASDAALAFSPAHLHIDILPAYQRQGWGRRLIGEVVRSLREEKGIERLWLGLDPRNASARRFYERIGFEAITGAPDNVIGLRFENWRD